MQNSFPKVVTFLGAALVLAACSPTSPESSPTPTSTPESAEVQQVESASNQIAEAFTSGASLKCDVTSTKEDQVNSQYLLKNKKMKMMTQATTENSDQFFSINDGTTIYMWSSDSSKPGIKMNLEEVKNAADSFDNQFQQFPDISDPSVREDIEDSGFVMNCTPAQIDDSQFVPPSDVTFTNPMEAFQGMMEKAPISQ